MDRMTVRSLLVRTGLVAVLFTLLGWLAIELVPGAGERLSQAAPGWVAAGIVLELIACAGFVACFAATFSYHPHFVPLRRSAQIALGELAAFAVVPTGVAAPLLRFWALMRGGMPLRTIAVRTVVHAPLLNVPYVAAALVLGTGVALGLTPGDAPLGVALAPIGVILLAISIALLVTRASRSPRWESATGWRRTALEVLKVAPDGLREIPARAKVPGAIGGAAVWWAGDCAVFWAAFEAMGDAPNLAIIVLAYMLGLLGSALPLPGGVGGVEPMMLAVLAASGVDAGLGAAAIVVYRAIALGLQSAIGAVAVGLLIPEVRAETRARSGQPGS